MSIDFGKFLSPSSGGTASANTIDFSKFGIPATPTDTSGSLKGTLPSVAGDKISGDIGPFAGPIEPFNVPSTPAPKPNIAATLPPIKTANITETQGTLPEMKLAQAQQKQIMAIPGNSYNDFVNKLQDSIKQRTLVSNLIGYNNWFDANSKTLSNDIQTGIAAANTVLSPISVGMSEVATSPGLAGHLAQNVNDAFGIVGKVVGKASAQTLDVIPSYIMSDETKNNLRPAIEQMGSFVGQALLAHTVGKLGGAFTPDSLPKNVVNGIHSEIVNNSIDLAMDHPGPVTPEVAHEIVTKAALKTTNDMMKSGTDEKLNIPKYPDDLLQEVKKYNSAEEFADSNWVKKINYEKGTFESSTSKGTKVVGTFEDLKPETRQELIDSKKALDEAKGTGAENSSKAGDRYFKAQETAIQELGRTKSQLTDIWNETQKQSTEGAPVGGSESLGTLTPKVASDVVAKLKEQNLLQPNFDDLPQVDKITFADQAKKASDLVAGDIERTNRILTGEEPMPSDLRAGPFLKAVEDLAIKTNDPELALKLANTPINAETSIHAQELVALKAINPDSLIAQMADVKKSREINVEKSQGASIDKVNKKYVDEGNKVIKQSAPKIKDWASFIDSIKC